MVRQFGDPSYRESWAAGGRRAPSFGCMGFDQFLVVCCFPFLHSLPWLKLPHADHTIQIKGEMEP